MILLQRASHPFHPSLTPPPPPPPPPPLRRKRIRKPSQDLARVGAGQPFARGSSGSLDEICKTGQRFIRSAPLSFKRHPVETCNVLRRGAPPRASSQGCVTADDHGRAFAVNLETRDIRIRRPPPLHSLPFHFRFKGRERPGSIYPGVSRDGFIEAGKKAVPRTPRAPGVKLTDTEQAQRRMNDGNRAGVRDARGRPEKAHLINAIRAARYRKRVGLFPFSPPPLSRPSQRRSFTG